MNWGQSCSGNWGANVVLGNLLLAVLVGTVWHWEAYKTFIQIPSESIIHHVSKWRCKRIYKIFAVMSSVASEHYITRPLSTELRQWIMFCTVTTHLMWPRRNICNRLYSVILYQWNVRSIVCCYHAGAFSYEQKSNRLIATNCNDSSSKDDIGGLVRCKFVWVLLRSSWWWRVDVWFICTNAHKTKRMMQRIGACLQS